MEKKTTNKIKLIPSYAVCPLLVMVTFNMVIYVGAEILTKHRVHYNLTTSLDRMIPLIPAFSIIYLGCYLFWVVNYIMIVRVSKSHCYRFALADLMSRVICGFFFLVVPTTNVRPHLQSTDIFAFLLKMVYVTDAPTRLFPSIHCLVSWFCYIGIRSQKTIPKWYQTVSLIFAILVCVSTQVTKQHYVIDVLGGIAIAEFCYWISGKIMKRLSSRKEEEIVK